MRFLRTLIILAIAISIPTQVQAGLRDFSGRLRLGVAGDFADPAERFDIAKREFNSITAENACKPDATEGAGRGQYTFDRCDAVYKRAQEGQMAFRGHTAIIWHGGDGGPGQNQAWSQNLSDNDKLQAMIDHITTTIKRYPQAYAWDIVNEALCGENNSFCSKFYPNNRKEEFVSAAFRAARAAATPGTKLFLNDFGHEFNDGSGTQMFDFIVKLRSQGVPIDGVGMQTHIDSDANIGSMRQMMDRYQQQGIEIHITEIDVGAKNGDFRKQADTYSQVLQACIDHSMCTSFTVWGITDERSWRGAGDQCLLFKNFEPKEAYNSVLDTLKRASQPPPNNNNNNNNIPSSAGAIAWKKDLNLVLDIPGGIIENGQKVEVWSNNGGANQLFSLTPCGNIKWTGTSKCLDVAGGQDSDGVAIQIWDCSCDNPNQLWDWMDTGLLKWRNHNRCIDVIGGVVQSGSFLQIYSCGNDNINQQFVGIQKQPTAPAPTQNPTTSNVFAIKYLGNNNNLVIDIPNANNNGGVRPQLWSNYGPGIAQRWQWTACGQLQWTGTDKCLDVSGGAQQNYANGLPIQIYTCWCGGANQIFQQQGNNIKLAGTNKCLDAAVGQSDGIGAGLQIWDCSGGQYQQFQTVSAAQQFIQSALESTVAEYATASNITLSWDAETVAFVPGGSRITFDTKTCLQPLYRVSESSFISCNITDSTTTPQALVNGVLTLPSTMSITSVNDFYVVCGSNQGCIQGQRQHIAVGVVSVQRNVTNTINTGKNMNAAQQVTSTSAVIIASVVALIAAITNL